MVTTSQLHTRGQIAPPPSNTIRAFAVPAPPPEPSTEEVEFSISTSESDASIFEHWSEDMYANDSDDSETDTDDDVSVGST